MDSSAQQIVVKVGSHEDVIRSTSMPAMIPHKCGLSRVSLTSTSSEHVRTSGSNVKEQFTSTIYRSPIIRTLVKFREAVVASSKKCPKLSVMSLLLLLSVLEFR